MNSLPTIGILLLACVTTLTPELVHSAPWGKVAEKAGQAVGKAAKNGLADDALRLAPLLIGLLGKLASVVAVVSAGIYVRDERRGQAELIAYLVAIAGGSWTAYAWLGLPFVRRGGARQGWAEWLGDPGPDVVSLSFTGLIGLALFAAGGVGICAWIARALGNKAKESGP